MKIALLFILASTLNFPQQDNFERWSTPQEITFLNEYFPAGVNSPYINSDGNELYFEVGGRIYYLEIIDSAWSAPILIDVITENIYALSPKISADDTKLFFFQNVSIHNNLFYIQRENTNTEWSEVISCGDNINTDSLLIEDYFLSNDTTLFIRTWSTIFCSNFDTLNNTWAPLKVSPDFYNDFFVGNSGGTFINSSYTKVYHTSTFLVWWIIDDQLYEIMRDYLAVSYKDVNNRFGQEHLLNINSDVDSFYNRIMPDQNYYCSSPSLTKDGKNLFFGVTYFDTTRIYFSKLLSDVNSVTKPIDNIVVGYTLMQNYPNPFNPTTNIGFRIAESGFVSLKVYDILGREVTTLVNELKRAGSYEVAFNGTNLANGIYIYRLESGKYSYTRKMILLK